MRMLNRELKDFVQFLMNIELAGKQSRMRSRFVKVVADRLQEMEEFRMSLVEKYANKEPDGSISIVGSVYDFPDDKRALFDTEYEEVLSEQFILDDTEERIDMLHTIKDAILNVETKFSGVSALQYDRWCDIVEAIS
jgi:hypothetical protein